MVSTEVLPEHLGASPPSGSSPRSFFAPTKLQNLSAVHDPTVAIGPPGGTARAALFGPDKGPEELPTPGSTINDGSWPSYPPYKPDTIVQQVNEKLRSYQESSALHTANQLGLPDMLADGPRTAAQLAAAIQNDEGMQLDASKLRRLMRFLVGRGIFERGPDTPDGLPQFQNNELTHHMRKEVSMACWSSTILLGDFFRCQSSLKDSLFYADKNLLEVHYGKSADNIFKYYQQDPEKLRGFREAMNAMAAPRIALMQCLDPGVADSPGAHIVDVGGGAGHLLAEMLRLRPLARGTVFERQQVMEDTRIYLNSKRLSDRAKAVAGDFFTGEGLPRSAEMYFIAYCLHDFQDSKAQQLLKVMNRAMAQHSILVIMEFVLPEDDLEAAGPITDMDMSIMTAATGQERTRADWDRLLSSSGLDLLRVDTPARGQPSFIYAGVHTS